MDPYGPHERVYVRAIILIQTDRRQLCGRQQATASSQSPNHIPEEYCSGWVGAKHPIIYSQTFSVEGLGIDGQNVLVAYGLRE